MTRSAILSVASQAGIGGGDMVLQDPHHDGWAILKGEGGEDDQMGYAFRVMGVTATWAPGDAEYLWVPGYSPPDALPAVDPPGSQRVDGSQLEWLA